MVGSESAKGRSRKLPNPTPARSPDGADFTLVVETLSADGDSGFCPPFAPTSAQNLTFLLAPGTGLPGPGARLLTAGLDGLVKVHSVGAYAVSHTARFTGQLLALGLH